MHASNPPSLYRRPLPDALIPFSSEAGRGLFREALEAGGLEGFFPLIEQFHTQSDPAFCGLGSLVMVLNALGVDPGRVWRGSWRWFSEELLDCCTPLAQVQASGLTIEEVACLARCNGANVLRGAVTSCSLEEFRAQVDDSARSTAKMLIASYSRAGLGQTGAGHFSPIGGYHAARDMLLVLDVARFKYPPHWVPAELLYEAMRELDPVTGEPRGWLQIEKRGSSSAVARLLACTDGAGTRAAVGALLERWRAGCRERRPGSIEALLDVSFAALDGSGIAERVRLRQLDTPEQRELLDDVASVLTALPVYRAAAARLGPERAPAVSLWWLAAPESAWNELPAELRAAALGLLDLGLLPSAMATEVGLLRSQVEFLSGLGAR